MIRVVRQAVAKRTANSVKDAIRILDMARKDRVPGAISL